MMEPPLSFGGPAYLGMLALLLAGRGLDFFSTWVATPNLVLEGNPIAQRLGWKLGPAVNIVLCLTFAFWPLTAITITTTSILVAGRNFQSAWLMRTLGEENYRDWFVDRMQQASLPLFLFCLAAQTGIIGVVGLSLTGFSSDGDRVLVVPFSIGLGIIGYAFTLLLYTSLSVWRIRRAIR